MSIAPITTEVEIRQPPEEAFRLFTQRISEWWHQNGIGAKPMVSLVMEPFAGGRWYETDEDGTITPWGTVLAWEPPSRVLLGWELDASFKPSASIQTEVELTFTPLETGGTRVSLEHRNLERFGADAERVASQIGQGWPTQLGKFAQFTTDEIEGES